jgi:phage terminase large subunit-like protein
MWLVFVTATFDVLEFGDEDAFMVVEVRQTMWEMDPATALFEKLLRKGKIRHGGHLVLSWMAGNCAVRQNQNENIMPAKNSTERVDGIVASIIGISRAVAAANAV